jgi:hypothetical protein
METRSKKKEQMEDLQKMLATLMTKLEENNKKLEDKLEENNQKLEDTNKNIEDRLEDTNKKIEDTNKKIEDANKSIEDKLKENNKKLEDKLIDYSKKLEDKIEDKVKELRKDIDDSMVKKEDIEYLVKKEDIEDLVKKDDIEDLVKKEVEKRISSTDVVKMETSSAIRMKPPTFDGKVPWSTYIFQFEAAAQANAWDSKEKATALVVSLRGEAMEVLRAIPEAERQNYQSMVQLLEMRYGDSHLKQVYRTQLKVRKQKFGESLQEYEADILKLVRLAYPTSSNEEIQEKAIESFVDGLYDQEISFQMRVQAFKDISHALARALEYEAARKATRPPARFRQIRSNTADQSQQGILESLREVIKQLEDGATKNAENNGRREFRRRSLRCWACGEEGHLQNRCTKAKDAPKTNSQDQGNSE